MTPEPVRSPGWLFRWWTHRDEISHAAYLINRYPDLEAEIERLKLIRVPESFYWEVDE